MPPQSLQTAPDYRPALLWLMNDLGSARAAHVLAEFNRLLGHLVPAAHRETTSSGHIRWEHHVHWSRLYLVRKGLMGSGGRGIWTIPEPGREWLRDHPDGNKSELSSLTAASQRKTSRRSRVRIFRWRGQEWRVGKQRLLAQASDLLAQGPPPEALRFRKWAIFVDRQPVSIKWLFHLVTEADYDQFDATTARRLLVRVGLQAKRIGHQPVAAARTTG